MRLVFVVTMTIPSLVAAQTTPWQRTEHPRDVIDFAIPGPGRVRLTIESVGAPQHVVIEHRDDNLRRPRVLGVGACDTPCVLYVPSATIALRARAWQVRDTELRLDAPAHPSVLCLRAASRSQWNLGVGLSAAGTTVFLALAGYALATQSTSHDALSTETALGGAIVSIALLAVGIPLLVRNRSGIASLTVE